MSLPAALPAAAVVFLGVMAFLGGSENMPMMLKVVVGLTVLLCALVALSPIAALLFGGKSAVAKATPAAAPVAATPAKPAPRAKPAEDEPDDEGFMEERVDEFMGGDEDVAEDNAGDEALEFDDLGADFEEEEEEAPKARTKKKKK
jgi:hypothetical protein